MSGRPQDKIIPPGATLGILGSGQLGRMLAIEARKLGYRVHVYSPEKLSPAGQIADLETAASYEDLEALRNFARAVDVVTFEFENIPSASVAAVAEEVRVHPSGDVLHITQHRLREKTFLQSGGFPVTPFRAVDSRTGLDAALKELGFPAILKTAGFGYDGKGQAKINSPDEAGAAFEKMAGAPAILEAYVPFEREISVVAARGRGGEFAHFGAVENRHVNHILDLTIAPAEIPPLLARQAAEMARAILEKLGVVGVMGVELFVTHNGGLLVNELAPRPHNSGHFTIDACRVNQFEQQLRAVCGLPLGDATQVTPAAMANLLGDLWSAGEPDWAAALALPGVKLHLYGKREARPGRKMGHLTALAATPAAAAALALQARDALVGKK